MRLMYVILPPSWSGYTCGAFNNTLHRKQLETPQRVCRVWLHPGICGLLRYSDMKVGESRYALHCNSNATVNGVVLVSVFLHKLSQSLQIKSCTRSEAENH